jgi:hypothetical protein
MMRRIGRGLMVGNLRFAAYVLLSMVVSAVSAAAGPEPAIDTTIRELNAHPQLYLGKKVRVVAYVAVAPNLRALYETLDDFPVMATHMVSVKYAGAVAFRGSEDWANSPYEAGRRAKVRVEGYFSDLCSPERHSLSTFGTCHDAPVSNILLSARVVELLAPGKAFSETERRPREVKATPADWPYAAEVNASALQMLSLLQRGAWSEFLSGSTETSRAQLQAWEREAGTQGRSAASELADMVAEIAPNAPGAIALFDETDEDVTSYNDPKAPAVHVWSINACFCRVKNCTAKWPSEQEQIRLWEPGGKRRALPFVCYQFSKHGNEPWRWGGS